MCKANLKIEEKPNNNVQNLANGIMLVFSNIGCDNSAYGNY